MASAECLPKATRIVASVVAIERLFTWAKLAPIILQEKFLLESFMANLCTRFPLIAALAVLLNTFQGQSVFMYVLKGNSSP